MLEFSILFFEKTANFVQLAIVFRGTLEIEILKLTFSKEMVEELTVLGQIYLRIAEDDTQTDVLKTLAVSNLFELQSTTLENSLYPA